MVRGGVTAGGMGTNAAGVNWGGSGCEPVRGWGCAIGWELVRAAGGTDCELAPTLDGGTGAGTGMDWLDRACISVTVSRCKVAESRRAKSPTVSRRPLCRPGQSDSADHARGSMKLPT